MNILEEYNPKELLIVIRVFVKGLRMINAVMNYEVKKNFVVLRNLSLFTYISRLSNTFFDYRILDL